MRLQNFSIFILVLFLLVLGPFATGNEEILELEDHGSVRVKRNLICMLGLQGLIENVFTSALEDIHKYDPMDVGDTEDGFLRSGVFYGLSTLTNVTALDVQCKGDKVIFRTTLRMTDARIRYKWNRRLLFRFSGSIWTKVKAIEFAIEVTWDVVQGMSFDVTSTEIEKMIGFRFGFTGLGPLNPVVSGIVNVLSMVWSHKISRTMAKLIKEALNAQFHQMSPPL